MISAEEEVDRSEWARSWGVAEVNQVDQLGNWTGPSVIAKTHHQQSAINYAIIHFHVRAYYKLIIQRYLCQI